LLFAIPFFVFGTMVFSWSFSRAGLNIIAPLVWFGLGLFLGYSKAKGIKRNAESLGIPSWNSYDPTTFVPAPGWENSLYKMNKKRTFTK
jgi:hypothetical protein